MRVSRSVYSELLQYIHDRLGFRLSAATRAKLETKLRLMRLPNQWTGLETFRQALVSGDHEAHELLVKTITVNHTFFFREREQFDVLAQAVQSQRLEGFSIWSAACSTGEEAYSLAILLLDKGVQDFRIVASDINPKVLHAVNQGVYHESRLQKVARHQLLRYFTREDEQHWRVVPELRNHLAIKVVNLVEPVRFEPAFEFVFCRNVFIYFDDVSRRLALETLRRNLRPGGLLFLGMTEALLEIPRGLEKGSHASYRRTFETIKARTT